MTAEFLRAETISAAAFAPFGDVLADGGDAVFINDGYARKRAGLAKVDAGADGKTRMHFFFPRVRFLPAPIAMMEKHPRGAQCFVPAGGCAKPWLAIVGEDGDGGDDDGNARPGGVRVFVMRGEGVCYKKNIWHFPLFALAAQRFVVADHGDGDDLQLHFFDEAKWIVAGDDGCDGNGDGCGVFVNPPSQMTKDGFMRAFGGIAEGSPWVAEKVWEAGAAGDTVSALSQSFAFAVLRAEKSEREQLIKAHPPLASAKAGGLSAQSQKEQSGAGLANVSAEEKREFAKRNAEYESQFGFPFVCAVAGLGREEILAALKRRRKNPAAVERAEALYQIFLIIRTRLDAMAEKQ